MFGFYKQVFFVILLFKPKARTKHPQGLQTHASKQKEIISREGQAHTSRMDTKNMTQKNSHS